MSTLRAIIIDDEPDSISLTQFILNDVEDVTVVATCLSVDEAIDQITQHRPDLLFLDIEMPERDGFDLLSQFTQPEFKVVFVSSYGHYALRAIKYSAVDYILKPVQKSELEQAIEKVRLSSTWFDQRISHLKELNKGKANYEKVILSSQKGFQTTHLSEIISIESKPGNYALFTLADGSYTLATKALNHYEELFAGALFFRIHRSFIVNLGHVKEFEAASTTVVLSNGVRLEVAHRRKAAFNNAFKKLYPF